MYGVMFFEEQDFVGPSETFGLRVVALLPLSIFRVARLKICFFVPAQAPFNVVTLRNHNTVGVFVEGNTHPQVRQDLLYAFPQHYFTQGDPL